MPIPMLQGESIVIQFGQSALTNYRVIGPGHSLGTEAAVLIDDVVHCGIVITARNITLLGSALLCLIAWLFVMKETAPGGNSTALAVVTFGGAIAFGCAYAFSGKTAMVVSAANGAVAEKLTGHVLDDARRFVNMLQSMKIQRQRPRT